MNVFDKIAICTFLLAILVWQALHQAHTFKQQKTISHFWKGVWYALAVGLVTAPYVSLYDWWYLIKIPVLGGIERMALFDLALNKARKYKWWYNGAIGTSIETGSMIDRLENHLSNSWIKVLKITYILLFILALIFIK